MKKAVLNKLKEIAEKDLPDMTEKRQVGSYEMGENLPVGGKDSQGRPYKKGVRYHFIKEENVKVDHLQRLKDAYKQGGDVAVTKYVGECHRKVANKKKDPPAQVIKRPLSEMVV